MAFPHCGFSSMSPQRPDRTAIDTRPNGFRMGPECAPCSRDSTSAASSEPQFTARPALDQHRRSGIRRRLGRRHERQSTERRSAPHRAARAGAEGLAEGFQVQQRSPAAHEADRAVVGGVFATVLARADGWVDVVGRAADGARRRLTGRPGLRRDRTVATLVSGRRMAWIHWVLRASNCIR